MEKRCFVGKEPKNDNGYFEEMSKVLFRSGFSRELIEKKWPAFRKAFAKFSIKEVAAFDERQIEELMENREIVRNHPKITATIDNARRFLLIQKERGSFKKFLDDEEKEGEKALCKTLGKRFKRMGPATSLFFLRAVGKEMAGLVEERSRKGET